MKYGGQFFKSRTLVKRGQLLLLFFLSLLLGACDGNYLVWSNDGKLGAVIGARGLRVCDSEGSISKVLYEKAGMFRWLTNSHQGLLVDYDYASSWAELKPLLSNEQLKQVEEESQKLRRKLFSYKGDPKKFAENALRTFNYPLPACLHLRALKQPDLEKLAAKKWPAFASVKVPVFYVRQVQVENNSLSIVRVLNKGIDEIVELRASPNGKYFLCVKHEHAQERNYIELVPLVAFARPLRIASDTNVYPAWSADGKAIYYSRANQENEPDLLKGAGVHEGALFKVDCIDSQGKPVSPLKHQLLARLIFDSRAPVRVLKDGRVLFLSREIRLPAGMNASPASALFALDGKRVDTVLQKNDDLVYFEPSPEQDQIALSFANGSLLVCKSKGEDASELCNGKDLKVSGILPQWKSNSELSYGTEVPGPRGSKPVYSIMLWSKGGQTKDLSKSWGKEAASELVVHRDIFQEAMTGVLEDFKKKH